MCVSFFFGAHKNVATQPVDTNLLVERRAAGWKIQRYFLCIVINIIIGLDEVDVAASIIIVIPVVIAFRTENDLISCASCAGCSSLIRCRYLHINENPK